MGRAEVQDAVRLQLGLSWVPAPIRTMAREPSFLAAAWRAIAPDLSTGMFDQNAAQLDALAGRLVRTTWRVPDHHAVLLELGIEREHAAILGVLRAFRRADARLLVVLEGLREAWEAPEIGQLPAPPARGAVAAAGRAGVQPARPPSHPGVAPVTLIDEADVAGDPVLEALYATIRRELGTPEVPDELQALARWPWYLEVAWRQVGPAMGGPAAARVAATLTTAARSATRNFREPIRPMADLCTALGLTRQQAAACHAAVLAAASALPQQLLTVAYLDEALNGGGLPEQATSLDAP